jgi:hypothetical protein
MPISDPYKYKPDSVSAPVPQSTLVGFAIGYWSTVSIILRLLLGLITSFYLSLTASILYKMLRISGNGNQLSFPNISRALHLVSKPTYPK